MESTLFEKISAKFGSLTGFYSYGTRKDEPGIYINYAVAKNFGIPSGMMSERALCEFVTRSVGGVNGRNLRHGEGLLFLRRDGTYSTVTYEPMSKDKRGYVREMRVRTSDSCLPLSALPNYARLKDTAQYRAGDVFCIASVIPQIDRGVEFDYACIAELFDEIRRKCKKPAIYWLGGREYAIMIKPDQLEDLKKVWRLGAFVDGDSVSFSISAVYIRPVDTLDEQDKKLAFCLRKLRRGIAEREYIFEQTEYEAEKRMPRGEALLCKIKEAELCFLPAVSVKTGSVKYFYAELRDAELSLAAEMQDAGRELFCATADKICEMILRGELTRAPLCVSLFGGRIDVDALKRIVRAASAPVYVEVKTRAARIDAELSRLIGDIKTAGAIPILFDAECLASELFAIAQAGFTIIRAARSDDAKIFSDFCRCKGLECALFGADTDEDFINARRRGVDICAGASISAPLSRPGKTHFRQPHIICDEEDPKPEKSDGANPLSRCVAKYIHRKLGSRLVAFVESKTCGPAERVEAAEKLEPLTVTELYPLDYLEGVGAKKDNIDDGRKKDKSIIQKRELQKKQIKAGRLKKLKHVKKI